MADDGQHFHHKDAEIEADTHGHLPQRRVDVPVDEAVPEAVRPADVEHEHQHSHAVADEADVDGCLGHRLQFLLAQQVGDGRDAERAGGQGDRRQVDGDPQPPGHQVGQVGHAEALDEDDQRRADTGDDEQAQEGHPPDDRLPRGGHEGVLNQTHDALFHDALSSFDLAGR